MKQVLSTLALVGVLSSSALSEISFKSGVWLQPRIYDPLTNQEVNYNQVQQGNYQFKVGLENLSPEISSTNLLGEILKNNESYLSHDWGEISMNANSSSYRQWAETLSSNGNYQLKFTINDGEFITRDFHVVPEPVGLTTLLFSGLALLKGRKIYS